MLYFFGRWRTPDSFRDESVIKCFWTGGWDSTFRILQLAISEKKVVQPIYLVDRRRKSLSIELRTMKAIRNALRKQDPFAAQRLLPTFILSKSSLRKNDRTRSWHSRLNRELRIGIQYEWFARFADQYNVDVEVGFIRMPDHLKGGINEKLNQNIQEDRHDCRLRVSVTEDSLQLFRRFRFPVFHLTKNDMRSLAETGGFLPLMKMTWFCLKPTPEGKACGKCHPCELVQGFGHLSDN